MLLEWKGSLVLTIDSKVCKQVGIQSSWWFLQELHFKSGVTLGPSSLLCMGADRTQTWCCLRILPCRHAWVMVAGLLSSSLQVFQGLFIMPMSPSTHGSHSHTHPHLIRGEITDKHHRKARDNYWRSREAGDRTAGRKQPLPSSSYVKDQEENPKSIPQYITHNWFLTSSKK